jgi:nifR3 family TIM-barrel protein
MASLTFLDRLSNVPQPFNAFPDFYVGEIPIHGDKILSPMSGFSDMPFRALCRQLGSAMSYTEFVSALDFLANSKRVGRRLAYAPQERPVVFQLFDNDLQRLLQAALRLQELGPDIIDINMGCSTKSVSGRGAGAGLMRTPLKVARIFRSLSRALEVPVTAKIRLGWDGECLNYRLISRIIEENGGKLIAVHGRTRAQGYHGEADWDAIAEIRQAVSIPVIGNGDVRSVADVQRLKAHTGCQGVMIARAAIGNPWIFADKDREQVPQDTVRQTMLRHLKSMQMFYGKQHGLVLFRKHLIRYISPYRIPSELRKMLLTCEQPVEFLALVNEIPTSA